MPFFSLKHVEQALTYLESDTHQLLPSILALAKAGGKASSADQDTIRFGSPQENGLGADFFRVPGADAERPLYLPFGGSGGKTRWREGDFAGSNLQRIRKERKDVFFQHKTDNKRWSFATDVVAALKADPTTKIGKIPIVIAYLAIWFYRDRDWASISEAVEEFGAEFRLTELNFVPDIFTDEIPEALVAEPMAPTQIDPAALLELVSARSPQGRGDEAHMPAPSVAPGLSARLAPTWNTTPASLVPPPNAMGLERPLFQAIAALASGKHVIFTGPPGCGKTTLAEHIVRSSGGAWETVPATDQWSTFETIGGYFPMPDTTTGAERLDFMAGAVVSAIAQGKCLILDEINRADIDKAFGELFTLLSGNATTLAYSRRQPGGEFKRIRLRHGPRQSEDADVDLIEVPSWWRLIGAMNDADKASLKRLSFAFTRRFAFVAIDLPDPPVYERIIRDEAARRLPAVPSAGPFTDALVELFAHSDRGFAACDVPLGPAFPLAMLTQAAAEWGLDPNRSLDEVLSSSFELHIMTQFQGRSDRHEDVVALLSTLIGGEIDRVDRHLRVWTGFVSP